MLPVELKEIDFAQEAQQRLAAWLLCMKKRQSDTRAIKESLAQMENLPLDEMDFGIFAPAAAYLNQLKQESPDNAFDAFVRDFLLAFNYTLQQPNISDQEPQLGARTIKRLYEIYHQAPQALAAALALYDFHLSLIVRRRPRLINQQAILPLLENVFLPLVGGLNIWALRRRWLMFYHQFNDAEQLTEIIKQYERDRVAREAIAKRLIVGLEQFLGQQGSQVKVEIYDRTPASLLRSSINRDDIIRMIVLQIICSKEEDCYLATMWLHQQGRIVNELSRNSLFHPEENGTRRSQVGIQLSEEGRLVLARIGLEDYMDRRNEWGVLATLRTQTEPESEFFIYGADAGWIESKGQQIFIYKWTGEKIHLEANSTLGDFVIQRYTLEQARHCTGAFVNTIKVSLGHQLQNGDVVQLFWDRWKRQRLPLSAWDGPHRSVEARQAVAHLRFQERQEALRGRLRILYVLQNYLAPWGFTLNESQLTKLLRAAGFDIQNQALDQILEQLTYDSSKDAFLCELALQFNLHQCVVSSRGEPLAIAWRNIRLAQCCLPTISDEIIGNQITGSDNPNDYNYGQSLEIKIHKKKCLYGPQEHNLIDLRWTKPNNTEQTQYGLKIMLRLEDKRGSLGGLMNLIYLQTDLSVHYVNADAINYGLDIYGRKIANIIFYVSAKTLLEINEAEHLLKQQYGEENVTAVRLQPDETSELTQPVRFNPYITVSEPELSHHIPVLMVGRSEQKKQVLSWLSQRKNVRIAIEGYYRSGKTWFLNFLQDTYVNPHELLVYIPLDSYSSQRISERNIVQAIYLRTYKTMNDTDPVTATQIKFNRPSSLFELQTWFDRVSKMTGYHFTLLIDEFSILNDWQQKGYIDLHFHERFYRFTYEAPSIGFVLVFQSALVHGLVEQNKNFSEWFIGRCDETVHMEPFTDAEIEQFLRDPVREYYDFEPEAIKQARLLTGGNPFIAAQLGRTIYRVANKRGFTKIDIPRLQEIVMTEILPAPEWRAYLKRMVEHLYGTPFELLKIIAKLQPVNGDDYVFEGDIHKHMPHNLEIGADELKMILKKLEKSHLLSSNTDNGEAEKISWKIASDLLAQNLTNGL